MTISARHFTTKARAWLLVAALTALLIGVGALVGGMFSTPSSHSRSA